MGSLGFMSINEHTKPSRRGRPTISPKRREWRRWFGRRIQQERAGVANLDQSCVAELLGISRHQLGRIESGDAEMTPAQVANFCQAIGITVGRLLQEKLDGRSGTRGPFNFVDGLSREIVAAGISLDALVVQQAERADGSKWTRAQLDALLSNKMSASMGDAVELCRVLGCSVQKIFGEICQRKAA